MANAGSAVVAMVAMLIGVGLGVAGLFLMMAAGSFAEAEHERRSGPLGLWGDESSGASVNTPAIVGLILALVGASALLFGLRALFVSFQGQRA